MKEKTSAKNIAAKGSFALAFSVGSVLFSAHAGGGFATGNQANTYYVGLGWLGPISAVIAMLLLTLLKLSITRSTNATFCLKFSFI